MVWYAGIITLVGAMAIFSIFIWLIGSTKLSETTETAISKIYGLRKVYFIALSLIILVTLMGSLRGLPYFSPSDLPPDYTVKIMGSMWAWNIVGITKGPDQSAQSSIESGKQVEFQVESADVNHGMGIYNAQGEILTQTQAMPGYPAKLYYTFDSPGTYHIVCMEYCGTGHHLMNQSFDVQ